MNDTARIHLDAIYSTDSAAQNAAYNYLMEVMETPVDWAYEAWDDLVEGLRYEDNHVRAISAQLLCNLAKSDPEKRMLKDFDALLTVTKDKRFVTARHALQSLWKIGMAGPEQRTMLVEGLDGRFRECESEKNCTLIRYDIIQDFKNLYDEVGDDALRQRALELIETEEDLKYRKKYLTVWRLVKVP